jgi:hypothetical protein
MSCAYAPATGNNILRCQKYPKIIHAYIRHSMCARQILQIKNQLFSMSCIKKIKKYLTRAFIILEMEEELLFSTAFYHVYMT